MQSVIIKDKMYTADRFWFAVQRTSEDDWAYGSDDLSTAVNMLLDQGCGLICVIADGKDPVALAEITFDDLFAFRL